MVTSVVVCGVLLAGCGGGSDDGAAGSPAASGPATSAAADAGGSSGGPGSLAPDERMAYMTTLVEIDPSLAANEETAIGNARALCREIAEGASSRRLVEDVRARFGGGLGPDEAERVLEAVRRYVCSS